MRASDDNDDWLGRRTDRRICDTEVPSLISRSVSELVG